MGKERREGRRWSWGELTRDQLAREAMHVAPEHLFAVLQYGKYGTDPPNLGRARRLDVQASTVPWLVDGLYLRDVGSRLELWLVEMQSRANSRDAGRAGGLLFGTIAQLVQLGLSPVKELHIHLFEVRTQQAARPGPAAAGERRGHGRTGSGGSSEGVVTFTESNRLLDGGEWNKLLLSEPAAWPLWAFGRNVGADEIVARIGELRSSVRYAGWIAALLRRIGRVRFPDDWRFLEALQERGEAMTAVAKSLSQLAEDDRLTEAEARERTRRYVENIRAQVEAVREEGRREALLALARSVAPDSVASLESMTDLEELQAAVLTVVRGPGGS